MSKISERNEWKFFGALPKADEALAAAWWLILVLRGVLPAVFAIAVGALVGAVERGAPLAGSLALVGAVFILLQVLTPIHQAVSANLGDRTAAWLYDRLTEACVRPPGMGHLENAALATDLTVARDFDLGMTGPPLRSRWISSPAAWWKCSGASPVRWCSFAYAWWAPLVLGGAWLATHWLLRESAIWRDRNTDEVRGAQRDAEYAYRLAVDPAPPKNCASSASPTGPSLASPRDARSCIVCSDEATRLREKPVIWSLLLVVGANVAVFWSLAHAATDGTSRLAQVVVFAQIAVGASMIAFGGINWALDGAAAPVAAVLRLEPAMAAGRCALKTARSRLPGSRRARFAFAT